MLSEPASAGVLLYYIYITFNIILYLVHADVTLRYATLRYAAQRYATLRYATLLL